MEELEKVIQLIRGITQDVDTRPTKEKHKIEQVAKYFEAHRDILKQIGSGGK
jgi:hypothetical protein